MNDAERALHLLSVAHEKALADLAELRRDYGLLRDIANTMENKRDAALEQVAALTKERDEAVAERLLDCVACADGRKELVTERDSLRAELATVREREARLEGALAKCANLTQRQETSPSTVREVGVLVGAIVNAALAPASPVLDHATKEKP